MLREFAIEPEAVIDEPMLLQALEQFGIENGRIIAKCPNNWIKRVYDHATNLSDMQKARLTERLNRVKSRCVFQRITLESDSMNSWSEQLGWRENALNIHSQAQFHALILKDNHEEHPQVLTPGDLHIDNSLWHIIREFKISRTAEAIADLILPLATISDDYIFIDPHMSGDSRWLKVFEQCINSCTTQSSHKYSKYQIHTFTEASMTHLKLKFERFLCPNIPSSVSVRVVKWSNYPNGEKMHARYFITDRGGIRFDYGLDEGQVGEMTDVALMSESMHQQRRQDFQDDSTTFKKECEISLQGTGSASKRKTSYS